MSSAAMVGVVVFLSAVMAGIIQTVTGFGSGIFMMMFFPAFFPLLNASALSSSIGIMVSGGVAWRYRKYSQIRLTLIPAIFYIIFSSVAISLGPFLPTLLLKKVFGAFLVVLSLYFLFADQTKKVKATMTAAILCAALSGIVGGLFGISGPPMVIYFLSALDNKEQYLGTLQLFFFWAGVYTLSFRIYSGIYTMNLLKFSALGLVGIYLGMRLGYKIVDRLDKDRMKKIIYLFLGLSGIVNLMK